MGPIEPTLSAGVRRVFFAAAVVAWGGPALSAPAERLPAKGKASSEAVDYLHDVRPILSNACYQCHGPDEESREADLRLDQREGAVAATSSGRAAVVPGDPEQSELYRRITSGDPDLRMPPPGSHKTLTAEQRAKIRKWIEQGAPWQTHWAFVPPQRTQPPAVSDPTWPRNAIDSFVMATLDGKGWTPTPEADKATLIRRLTLHLTGLPPTLDEVNAFAADDAPDAYERLVDRLMASPHYGEHMARFWLDVARYGDTHGLHLDNYREMWLYRDWVTASFNSNLPYDQFIVQQLAGDLLPKPTLSQRIATGFCRSNVSTNEGGSIEEEVYVRNVVDRVNAVGTAFLGLTIGCARCHDHKYDPLTQKEYYQLFAFFNSLEGPALDGNVKDPAPFVHVPGAELRARLAGLRRVLAAVRTERDALVECRDAAYEDWRAIFLRGEQTSAAEAAALCDRLAVGDGLVVQCNFDGAESDPINSASPKAPGRMVGPMDLVEGVAGRAFRVARDGYVDLGNVGDFEDVQPFSFGGWVKADRDADGIILAKSDSEDLFRGYELSVNDGFVRTQMGRRDPGYLVTVVTNRPVISPNQWHHVFVTYDGSRRASGLVVYVDGERQAVEIYSDALKYKSGIRNAKPLLLGRRDAASVLEGALIDDVRVYDRRLADSEVQSLILGVRVPALRQTPQKQWLERDADALRRAYLLAHDATYGIYCDEIDRLSTQLQREAAEAPTTLVFRERRRPNPAFVLVRGEYDQHGEPVARRTPVSLPPMAEDQPRDRLGLAQWLVSPSHPLASRVAVNRFWQQFFGVGLVKTSEDFGNQGDLPSHPELIDWLAVDFREHGWDVKRLVKQIVTSSTYRQASRVTPERAAADPENRLLSHGARFRLDAESLRDQALSLSGMLVTRMGGPSVKPPQPAGLWEAVGFVGSNTAIFEPDSGHEKVHRRSLYTFLKRTAPAPELSTFDAPSRESPCMRRERTNTPMQALLLLNDPQYVDAARALAARVMRARASTDERARYMYLLCTAHDGADAAISELVHLHDVEHANYRNDPAAARRLTAGDLPDVGADELEASEWAAWTVVANLMLNLDEVINAN